MAPAAPGLRAMPSHAADAMRPCARPQPNAAMAMPNPTAIPESALLLAPAGSCANAAGANMVTTTSIRTSTPTAFSSLPPVKPPGGGSRAPCSRAHTEAAERNLVEQVREKHAWTTLGAKAPRAPKTFVLLATDDALPAGPDARNAEEQARLPVLPSASALPPWPAPSRRREER